MRGPAASRLALFVGLLSAPAFAERPVSSPPEAADSRIEAARAAFRQGVEAAQQQRFAAAAAAFERSLALVQHAATHYNLSRALLAENRLLAARTQLLRAQARETAGGPELALEQRSTVAQLLAEIERRLVRVQFSSKGTARVSVDGRAPEPLEASAGEVFVDVASEPGYATLDGAFTLALEPGPHAVVVEQSGVAVSFALDEAEGARRSFTLAPALPTRTRAAAPPATPVLVRAVTNRADPTSSRFGASAGAAFGVAVLGAASAAIFGVLAVRAKSELDDVCPTPKTCPSGSAGLRARLERWAILTDVSLGVSVVGLGLGAYVTLTPPLAARPAQASIRAAF